MTTLPGRPDGAENATPSLRDVAVRVVPGLDVVSMSNPEPVLRTYNVLGLAPSAERARRAVVGLEGLEHDDAAIGVVVFGAESAEPADGRADEAHVTGTLFPRVVVGGLVGLVVGAVLVGGGAALLGAESAWIGAALGGGAMGFVFGASWTVFARMGGSDAYRQTFVEPQRDELTLVSLHTDDPEAAAAARQRLDGLELRVFDVSPTGDVRAA